MIEFPFDIQRSLFGVRYSNRLLAQILHFVQDDMGQQGDIPLLIPCSQLVDVSCCLRLGFGVRNSCANEGAE